MVKHIVFFKLRDNISDKTKAIKTIETLSPLQKQIEQIKFYELGTNFATSQTAYDIALLSHFDTKQDLDTYRNHPLHRQAVDKIKQYISKTAVVDYEI